MSVLGVHSIHELHQLKKALLRLRGVWLIYQYYQSI